MRLSRRRLEIDLASLERARLELGEVSGPSFEQAAARMREEQPLLIRSVLAALVPSGDRGLHLGLEYLVVLWRALELASGLPPRRVSRANYLRRSREVAAWLRRRGEAEPRLLRRWLSNHPELPQPEVVAELVRALFEAPSAALLGDARRAILFRVLLAALGAMLAAGGRRSAP